MTVFYLIRHAHAVWTPDEQRPLSPQGREDARWVAELLRRYPITQVYAIPYRRAWETVAPLAEALGLPDAQGAGSARAEAERRAGR